MPRGSHIASLVAKGLYLFVLSVYHSPYIAYGASFTNENFCKQCHRRQFTNKHSYFVSQHYKMYCTEKSVKTSFSKSIKIAKN